MRTDRVLLAGVVCLAVGLRVWALNWGLPDFHHPDEPWILNRALAFAKGGLNPKNFLYPTLYFYALFVWEGAFFVVGRVAGLYQSLAAFEREFFTDPTHIVTAGRALTATFGVATVLAVYQFGARLYDRRTGLMAALLLAVAPFAVRDAHYIKLDVPMTLFIVLCQAAVARLVVDGEAAAHRRGWLIAGAMAGLALSTQYYAFPVILSIVAAAAIHARRTGARPAFVLLVWAGFGSIAAFVMTSPFFVLEPAIVARDMAAVKQIDIDRAVAGEGVLVSLGAYVKMMASDAAGWGTALAALAGFIAAMVTDWRRGVVLLCFPIAFLAFLTTTVPMSRYLNPMLPSLALAAAVAIRWIVAFGAARITPSPRMQTRSPRMPTRSPGPLGPGFAEVALVVIVAMPGFIGSRDADHFYAQTDTRTLAREFIERTAPPGSGVLVQPHSVQVRPSHEGLVEALRAHLGSESLATIKFQKQLQAAESPAGPAYRVYYIGVVTDGGFDPEKIYISPDDFSAGAGLQPLRARRIAYVALNRYNTGGSDFGLLDAALHKDAQLLATFSPYPAGTSPDRRAAVAPFFHNTDDEIDTALERPGPIVEVWRIE
jgi:hypothetical protein